MKKILSIAAALLLALTLSAQDARQRTVTTIVQDALAQMPFKTASEAASEFKDLADNAPESVLVIALMMEAPVKGTNSPMEYAVHGLTTYAATASRAARKAVTRGMEEAVEAVSDSYVKAFLQSELRLLKARSFKPEMMDAYETEVSEEAAREYAIALKTKSDVFVLSEQEEKEGYEILFDGTNLSKWMGNKEGYTVQDGNIRVTAKFGNEQNLYTVKEYRDFVFRFEFCFLKSGVNNGVGVRTPVGVDAAYDAMCECQILDHDAPIYKGLKEYQVHGSAYGIIPAKRIVHKPLGEWSTEEIIVRGDCIKVTVNGEVILDGNLREACQGHNVSEDGSKNNPFTVDGHNHPGMFNEKGHISFCGHGEGLLLRNVRVKEL